MNTRREGAADRHVCRTGIAWRVNRAMILAVALAVQLCILSGMSLAEQRNRVFSGEWTATVGTSLTLRGQWIGEPFPDQPNEAHGSWTLSNESGRIAMTGTWWAQKTPRGWQGNWRADDRAGRSVAGTWKADWTGPPQGTFEQMLEFTLQQELSGSWRSAGTEGYWWLKGKISQTPIRP